MLIMIERLACQHRFENNNHNNLHFNSYKYDRYWTLCTHHVNKHRQIGWANIDSKIIIIAIHFSTAINTIGTEHYVHIMLINIERLAYQHRIINNHSNSSISTAINMIGIDHYVHIVLINIEILACQHRIINNNHSNSPFQQL